MHACLYLVKRKSQQNQRKENITNEKEFLKDMIKLVG